MVNRYSVDDSVKVQYTFDSFTISPSGLANLGTNEIRYMNKSFWKSYSSEVYAGFGGSDKFHADIMQKYSIITKRFTKL
jgi:hypothetical protein